MALRFGAHHRRNFRGGSGSADGDGPPSSDPPFGTLSAAAQDVHYCTMNPLMFSVPLTAFHEFFKSLSERRALALPVHILWVDCPLGVCLCGVRDYEILEHVPITPLESSQKRTPLWEMKEGAGKGSPIPH